MRSEPVVTGSNEACGVDFVCSAVWSVARTWTLPATGVVERSNLAGVGTGDLATLLADSGAPVPTGADGGATATVPAASNRATVFTVVLAPLS